MNKGRKTISRRAIKPNRDLALKGQKIKGGKIEKPKITGWKNQ
jgi:hypothetical protein